MRQVVLDTETTGLDPDDGHRLVEVAGIEIANRQVISTSGSTLHLYVNPGRDSDPEALDVHGLTTDFLSQHPPFEQIAEQVVDFITGAELIIHNAPFDVKFLNAELARCGFKSVEHYAAKITDSLVYARELHPGKRNNLDALCDRYGISNEHRVLHGALLDSELLADVWLAMTRGQDSLIMSFDTESSADSDGLTDLRLDTSGLAVIKASAVEVKAHYDYLDKLADSNNTPPLWYELEPKPVQ